MLVKKERERARERKKQLGTLVMRIVIVFGHLFIVFLRMYISFWCSISMRFVASFEAASFASRSAILRSHWNLVSVRVYYIRDRVKRAFSHLLNSSLLLLNVSTCFLPLSLDLLFLLLPELPPRLLYRRVAILLQVL